VVWEGLQNARIAFEQGGSTGWKGCVMGVRLALENWQKIEPEDLSQSDKTKRTKRQRLDHLRWSLLQIGHFFAHNGAEECSRDDAMLLLSTLSTLLAERKP
jgi:hypothetical protein